MCYELFLLSMHHHDLVHETNESQSSYSCSDPQSNPSTIYKIDSFMAFGYKTKYLDEVNGINFEISIYNEKYKNIILYEHNNSRFFPFYITFILYIIKILFYDLKLISKQNYKRCKRFLMNPDDELRFIVVDT